MQLEDMSLDDLGAVMAQLNIKHATALGSTSKVMRAALERKYPDRYKGPPDYTKGKGKYQEYYDALENYMRSLSMVVYWARSTDHIITRKEEDKLRKDYLRRLRALDEAKEAYAEGRLVHMMTTKWKDAKDRKYIFDGILDHLRTMGPAYEPAIQVLEKKREKLGILQRLRGMRLEEPNEDDESQTHRIMDALVHYLPTFVSIRHHDDTWELVFRR
jgi:hypothetical protein